MKLSYYFMKQNLYNFRSQILVKLNPTMMDIILGINVIDFQGSFIYSVKKEGKKDSKYDEKGLVQ